MIPEGWKSYTLGELSDPRAPIRYGVVQIGPFTPGGVPIVPIKHIGRIDRVPLHLASREVEGRYANSRICGGDVLLSVKGTIGEVGIVPEGFNGNIAREIARIRPNDKVQGRYLANLLAAPETQQRIDGLVVGSTRREFSIATARKFEVVLPPLAEQRRIADIFSTWDRAIETVEALIANAHKQKTALMQTLLTGERRLPGFTAVWSAQRLSDVAEIIVSNVDKKTRPGERAVRLCNYTDVYASDRIESDQAFMPATASSAQIERFGLCVGDVVITKDSETPGDIAVPSYVASTSPDLVCGYHLAILRPKTADGQFLKYLLEQPVSRQYFASRANGATRFGLTVGAIEETPLVIPELDEQQAIGEVVRAAELILHRLNSQLADLLREKVALMQQLLTGKRRVKVIEEADA
jgi:type I restriction enzyme S subunit